MRNIYETLPLEDVANINVEIQALKALFPDAREIQDIRLPNHTVTTSTDLLTKIKTAQRHQQLSVARRLLDQVPMDQRNRAEYLELAQYQSTIASLAREHYSKYKTALDADDTDTAREEIRFALNTWRDNQTFINRKPSMAGRRSLKSRYKYACPVY